MRNVQLITPQLIAAAVLLTAVSAPAQTRRFAIAVIRPIGTAPPGASVSLGTNDGGRFVARGVTAQVLVQLAYSVQRYQIAGAPAWFSDEAFDIEAKPEPPFSPTPDESKEMVRTLLAERFGLKVHQDTREGTVFNLVVAKGGPKFNPTTTSPEKRFTRGGMGSFSATGVRLEFFLQRLSAQLERPIYDRTGLNGEYDIELHWTPQRLSASAQVSGEPSPDGDDPALATALEEQLGLKLERAKGPIETLVIEAAERPGQN
jgi:uncharacterized protein (TIGR03435 family)